MASHENAGKYMIRVAMIARSTLYSCRGGDTVQVVETAKCLREQGVTVDIKLAHEKIDYTGYSLLHFFNVIRPADILVHVRMSRKPYVISTVFVDYAEYELQHRRGLAGKLFRWLHPDAIEYCKAIARSLQGKDSLQTLSYVWRGHRRSVQQALDHARILLPNSDTEYSRLQARYRTSSPYQVVTNGIDQRLFAANVGIVRDPLLVICVARIEGIKNQLNLIRALSDTKFRLVLIGTYAPNHLAYYKKCRQAAGPNISFIGQLPQAELVTYYRLAKVHVLPSWFETTGLSSLEAAAMGCNVVITAKGDTNAYFGDHAFYCNPASPHSILQAIEAAAGVDTDTALQQKIRSNHTWQQAAIETKKAYTEVLNQL